MTDTCSVLERYDEAKVQLGKQPWSSIEVFTSAVGINHYRLRIGRALRDINQIALQREGQWYSEHYEHPILFYNGSVKPFEKFRFPDDDSDVKVDIAMDALHGYLKARALDKETDTPENSPGLYSKVVSAGTLDSIVYFVNRFVVAANAGNVLLDGSLTESL